MVRPPIPTGARPGRQPYNQAGQIDTPESVPDTLSGPSTGPLSTGRAESAAAEDQDVEDLQVNWAAVDKAMEAIEAFDVLELSEMVVDRALAGGSQNAYNEAGAARFKVVKLKQQFDILRKNILAESLEAKKSRIAQLTTANMKKRLLAHAQD